MQIERVLVWETNREVREFLSQALVRAGCRTVPASNIEEAQRLLGEGQGFDLVLANVEADNGMGREILARARAASRPPEVVLTAGPARAAGAVEAGGKARLGEGLNLPPELLSLKSPGGAAQQGQGAPGPEPGDLNQITLLSEVERRVILRTLKVAKGNRTRAARLLGISVRTLYTKLREYQSAEARTPDHEEAIA